MTKRDKLEKEIKESLLELGIEEVQHYYNDYWNKKEVDYNIAQYGGLLIYYDDIRELYRKCGYKVENYSDMKLWEGYKVVVGKMTRELMKEV